MGLDLVGHHAGGDIQVRRGVFLHPIRALQGLDQGFPFNVLEGDALGRQSDDPILRLTRPGPPLTQTKTAEAHCLSRLLGHSMRDRALQFAQIPWPRVAQESSVDRLIEAFNLASKESVVTLQKHLGKGQDVFGAVTEGGHFNPDPAEPPV